MPIVRNLPHHHWEDWHFFRHTHSQIQTPLDCFTKASVWPGLYRPLSTNCYYLFGRVAFHNRIEAYHFVNAALVVANAILLFALGRRLPLGGWEWTLPVLFASRLAHVQVVLYTSEFQGLSCACLSLLAMLAVFEARLHGRRRGELLGLLAFVLALLCKESAIVLPVLVTAWSCLFEPRPGWRNNLLFWLVAAAWAVLFATVLRGVSGHQATGFGYDLSASILHRYVSYFLAFFNVLVYPIDERDMVARVPALAGTGAVLVGCALLAAILLAALGFSRRLLAHPRTDGLRVMTFGFVWFAAGMAPFVIFSDRLFMRYGYFGHAGVAVMLAGAMRLASQTLSNPFKQAAGPEAKGPTTALASP